MRPDPVRRGLVWGLGATLLLPMVIAVSFGTASLLAAVGDTAAAGVCRWASLPLAILWAVAVDAPTALSAVHQLLPRPRRPRRSKPCTADSDR
jgi:hypothetical protein